MPVRRLIALAMALLVTCSACGFALNTGNNAERAEWNRAERERKQKEDRRRQTPRGVSPVAEEEVLMPTTTRPPPSTSTIPTTSTTTSTTTPQNLEDEVWCDDLTRAFEIGQTMHDTLSISYWTQSFQEVQGLLTAVQEEGSPEAKLLAGKFLRALQELDPQLANPSDRTDLEVRVDEFADQHGQLFEDLKSLDTRACPG